MPSSWRLVAPITYPGSANKVDGLPGMVGHAVRVKIVPMSSRAPHSRRCVGNSTANWNCACGVKGCPKHIAAKGHKYTIPMCITCS